MRVVVLDGDRGNAVALERQRGRRVVRVQVVRDELRRDREQPLEVRDALDERRARRGSSRSPMWWPTQARAPLATQNVLFSWAPYATSGARHARGSAMPSGTQSARAP